jgi:chromosome partitioning protein
MAIIIVASLKGGTAKTTLAVNLSAALPAALIDADPQASAAGILGDAVHRIPLKDRRGISAWVQRVRATASAGNVIIDLPPSLGEVTQAAMLIADFCLIPVSPSALDLRAAVQCLELWKGAKASRNAEPGCILVPVRVDKRTTPGREIAAALKGLGEAVAPPLGSRTDYVMSAAAGLPVAEYAPRSIAAAEVKALAKFIRRKL